MFGISCSVEHQLPRFLRIITLPGTFDSVPIRGKLQPKMCPSAFRYGEQFCLHVVFNQLARAVLTQSLIADFIDLEGSLAQAYEVITLPRCCRNPSAADIALIKRWLFFHF